MNLDNAKLNKIQLFATSSSFEVVLDLLEAECDRAEVELLKANPVYPQEVFAAHSKARAYRELFERFQTSVRQAASQGQEFRHEMSHEDIIRAQCQL